MEIEIFLDRFFEFRAAGSHKDARVGKKSLVIDNDSYITNIFRPNSLRLIMVYQIYNYRIFDLGTDEKKISEKKSDSKVSPEVYELSFEPTSRPLWRPTPSAKLFSFLSGNNMVKCIYRKY